MVAPSRNLAFFSCSVVTLAPIKLVFLKSAPNKLAPLRLALSRETLIDTLTGQHKTRSNQAHLLTGQSDWTLDNCLSARAMLLLNGD